MAHRITEEFRKRLPKKEPAAKPGEEAAQSLKPLTDEELASLSESDRAAYKKRLKDAQSALKEAQDKKDPAGIIAANEELAALFSEYRKKTGAPAMDPASDFNAFKKLSHDERKKVCESLKDQVAASTTKGDCAAILQDAAAETLKCNSIKKGKDQETLEARNACMSRIKACQSESPSGKASASTRSVDPNVKFACQQPDFGDQFIADARKPSTERRPNMVASMNPVCKEKEELSDGKCVAKKDPNSMLDVKAGVIGAVGGAFLGLLGGPIGALIGAAVGFAVFYYANKTLR